PCCLLADFHEVRNAVENHPERERRERQKNENKIGRLLTGQLQRVEVSLLDGVDLVQGLRKMIGFAGVKEFSTGGRDGCGDLLRSAGLEGHPNKVHARAFLAGLLELFDGFPAVIVFSVTEKNDDLAFRAPPALPAE